MTGIVHRYPDRVLLKAVHVCPVYCRFCFRREMVGPQGLGTLTSAELDAAVRYIAEHRDIWEVILTGGDPLVLSARRLREIMQRLSAIAHVKVVRFHTRVPVVEPERIDADLVEALKASDKTTYVALHANHPRELTAQARAACARLVDAGVVMISQTVLLKGVNDDADVLAELMRAFVENRIRPYYLHHPDLAPGTSHFRLGLAEGRALVEGLRGRISGLCQPTYIIDIPGGYGKVPVLSTAVQETDDGCFRIRDFRGAMVGRADKGLVMTTGTFSTDARREATRDGAPAIDLVDGETLCELLKSLKIGVSIRNVEHVLVEQQAFLEF